MAVGSTKVVQVTNIAPQATKDQMQTLFGYLGKIEDIRLYPTIRDVSCPVQSRICYIKFIDSTTVGIAQHMTNTVFIDRALIVIPVQNGEIPDEYYALEMTRNGALVPGINLHEPKLPPHVSNSVEGTGKDQVIMTSDPQLEASGLPIYPPLPVNYDSTKIEETRRTICVQNIDPSTTHNEIIDYFSSAGEVKYIRTSFRQSDNLPLYLIEYSDQPSILNALNLNNTEFKDKTILVQHATQAIVKPQAKSNEAAQKEIEEALQRFKEAQNMINASIEPVIGMLTKDKRSRRSRSRSHGRRRRSRSRSSRRRSRSRKRSRSRRRTKSRERRRRSRSKKRSTSRSKRSRSKSSSRRRKSRDRDSKSRARSKDRKSRDRSKDRKRSRDRKSKDKEPTKLKDKESSKERDKSKDREKSKDKEKGKEKARSKERERARSKERDRKRSRSKDRESRRKRSRSRDKEREKSKERGKSKERESRKSRDREKSKDVSRESKEKRSDKESNVDVSDRKRSRSSRSLSRYRSRSRERKRDRDRRRSRSRGSRRRTPSPKSSKSRRSRTRSRDRKKDKKDRKDRSRSRSKIPRNYDEEERGFERDKNVDGDEDHHNDKESSEKSDNMDISNSP